MSQDDQVTYEELRQIIKEKKYTFARFDKIPGRIYPENELASQLIGYMGDDGVEQQTVEAKINPDSPDDPDKIKFKNAKLKIKGRHDVCLCPRIVPVVEAMTYIVLADMILRS